MTAKKELFYNIHKYSKKLIATCPTEGLLNTIWYNFVSCNQQDIEGKLQTEWRMARNNNEKIWLREVDYPPIWPHMNNNICHQNRGEHDK